MRYTFLVFFVLLCFLVQSAKAELVHDKVYEAVMSSKKIRCGYADWAPWIVTDPNTRQVSGLMKDLMDEVGKRIGVKVEWAASLGWGEITEAANSGKIDMFCNTQWTDTVQLQNMSLSRPLFYSPTFAFARIDDKRFDNNYEKINSPETTIVGIDGDTSYVTMQEHFPKAKMLALSTMSSVADQFINIASKKGDVTLADNSVFDAFDKTNPGKLKQIPGKPLFIMNEVLVTRAGEQQFMNVINTALISLINEGYMDKILKKYGINSSYAPKPDFDMPEMYKRKEK